MDIVHSNSTILTLYMSEWQLHGCCRYQIDSKNFMKSSKTVEVSDLQLEVIESGQCGIYIRNSQMSHRTSIEEVSVVSMGETVPKHGVLRRRTPNL